MRRRPPPRVVRLRNLTLAPKPKRSLSTRDLGHLVLWTGIATIVLCAIVLIWTGGE